MSLFAPVQGDPFDEVCSLPSQINVTTPWPRLDDRPLLGANGTEAMAALLETDGASLVDYLKVGPFQGSEGIGALASRFPLMLHLDDALGGDPLTEQTLQSVMDWVHLTGTPWTSEHISYAVRAAHLHTSLEPWSQSALMTREETFDRIVGNARLLVNRLDVPLILENIPFFPNVAHLHVCEPAFVAEVIEATDCGFLLDLAHARVSACALGLDIHEYISALPLDRVIEFHLSGPRPMREVSSRLQERLRCAIPTVGHLMDYDESNLVDAHEPMRGEDYALLEWVLARAQPKAISLEYYRDPQSLREQLVRLNEMIGRVPD